MKRIFTLLLLTISIGAFAQDCYPNFDYYREVTLTATQPSVLDAHTVAISIDVRSLVIDGKLRPNGSDLRVTDEDCNDLPFFINEPDDREFNVLYVSVPEINTGGLNIQLYYGNSSATTKIDGNAVFDWFDDFEDGVVDLNKWETVGAYSVFEEVNGELNFAGASGTGGVFQYIAPAIGFDYPVSFEFTAPSHSSRFYGFCDTDNRERFGYRATGSMGFDTLDLVAGLIDTLNGGGAATENFPLIRAERNQLNTISMSAFADENDDLTLTGIRNYSELSFNDDSVHYSFTNNYKFQEVRPFFTAIGSPTRIGFLGVRPAIQGYPEIVFGDEMVITGIEQISAIDFGIQIYPQPAQTYLKIDVTEITPDQMQLYSIIGQKVLEQEFSNQLDASDLPAGQYLLKMNFENGDQSVDKIIITH